MGGSLSHGARRNLDTDIDGLCRARYRRRLVFKKFIPVEAYVPEFNVHLTKGLRICTAASKNRLSHEFKRQV